MECLELAPIPNGDITYDPDVTAPYDVDTVATHSCDPGFRLSGFETRQCLAGGIWSNLIPVCLGTYKIIIMLILDCACSYIILAILTLTCTGMQRYYIS